MKVGYKMETLYKQIENIIDDKLPLVSNLANVSALLFKMDNLNWAGFYISNGEYLYLGPFQGEVACTIIPFNKGVCGKAFSLKQTLVVDDVNKFDGHIACSSLSKSEIVVPIIYNDQVVAVIDIDSPIYSRFSEKEKMMLEKVADLLAPLFAK